MPFWIVCRFNFLQEIQSPAKLRDRKALPRREPRLSGMLEHIMTDSGRMERGGRVSERVELCCCKVEGRTRSDIWKGVCMDPPHVRMHTHMQTTHKKALKEPQRWKKHDIFHSDSSALVNARCSQMSARAESYSQVHTKAPEIVWKLILICIISGMNFHSFFSSHWIPKPNRLNSKTIKKKRSVSSIKSPKWCITSLMCEFCKQAFFYMESNSYWNVLREEIWHPLKRDQWWHVG